MIEEHEGTTRTVPAPAGTPQATPPATPPATLPPTPAAIASTSAPPSVAEPPAVVGRRSPALPRGRTGARKRPRVLTLIAIVLGVAGLSTAIVLAWRPAPVVVDMQPATVGPLEITVDEDGRTRVKDRYVVSAPVVGTLARVELRAGDSVRQGDVVARLTPLVSPLLDPRARTEAVARVAAADAGVRQAMTAVARARAASGFARREADRLRPLLRQGATSQQAMEEAELAERTRAEEAASAEFGLRVARSERDMARAALLRLDRAPSGRTDELEIRSPVSGLVLRLVQESEGAVSVGAPLLEIGDPGALEVVVDILTADAVDVHPGTPVRIERWGGDSALQGHVHRVEPSAFTRLSSLGIEEQRVNVVVDLDGPAARRSALGDGYRVEARIVVWSGPDVLQVPTGAVFRRGTGWAAYVVDPAAGRAHLRPLRLGRRNGAAAQVVEGITAGEQVIVYPGDDVADGGRVATH